MHLNCLLKVLPLTIGVAYPSCNVSVCSCCFETFSYEHRVLCSLTLMYASVHILKILRNIHRVISFSRERTSQHPNNGFSVLNSVILKFDSLPYIYCPPSVMPLLQHFSSAIRIHHFCHMFSPSIAIDIKNVSESLRLFLSCVSHANSLPAWHRFRITFSVALPLGTRIMLCGFLENAKL